MSSAFVLLDLMYERRGSRITLDSFGSVPTWSFFVRGRGHREDALTLAEGDVTLIDTHGDVVGTAVEVSTPLLEVAAR